MSTCRSTSALAFSVIRTSRDRPGPQALRRAAQLWNVASTHPLRIDLMADPKTGRPAYELDQRAHACRTPAADVVDATRQLGGCEVGADHVPHIGDVAGGVGVAGAKHHLGGPRRLGLGHLPR